MVGGCVECDGIVGVGFFLDVFFDFFLGVGVFFDLLIVVFLILSENTKDTFSFVDFFIISSGILFMR